MPTSLRKHILEAIIKKGGLFGRFAEMYLPDEILGHLFILECVDQCRNNLGIEYFGKDLVREMINYSENVSHILRN